MILNLDVLLVKMVKVKKKKEGDKKTPIGQFAIENLYYRSDRIQKTLN